eukprot:4132276-Amphidinium_carterae.1
MGDAGADAGGEKITEKPEEDHHTNCRDVGCTGYVSLDFPRRHISMSDGARHTHIHIRIWHMWSQGEWH